MNGSNEQGPVAPRIVEPKWHRRCDALSAEPSTG